MTDLKKAIKRILDEELIVSTGEHTLYWASMGNGEYIICPTPGAKKFTDSSDYHEFTSFDEAFEYFMKVYKGE